MDGGTNKGPPRVISAESKGRQAVLPATMSIRPADGVSRFSCPLIIHARSGHMSRIVVEKRRIGDPSSSKSGGQGYEYPLMNQNYLEVTRTALLDTWCRAVVKLTGALVEEVRPTPSSLAFDPGSSRPPTVRSVI